jgi:hypothetical protein
MDTRDGKGIVRRVATWVKNHLIPCIPNVSPENPAMVICDGNYAHIMDEVLDICEAMGIFMVLLPPHCTHELQGEDLYHFGVFKTAFRVARAQTESAIQLAAGWFINRHTHEGVAVWSAGVLARRPRCVGGRLDERGCP